MNSLCVYPCGNNMALTRQYLFAYSKIRGNFKGTFFLKNTSHNKGNANTSNSILFLIFVTRYLITSTKRNSRIHVQTLVESARHKTNEKRSATKIVFRVNKGRRNTRAAHGRVMDDQRLAEIVRFKKQFSPKNCVFVRKLDCKTVFRDTSVSGQSVFQRIVRIIMRFGTYESFKNFPSKGQSCFKRNMLDTVAKIPM